MKDSLLQFNWMAAKEENRIWQQRWETFDSGKQIRLGSNLKRILLIGAQLPILQHVHRLMHWDSKKIISGSKEYYWKPSPTIACKVYSRCFICPKYNPRKLLHGSLGQFPLSFRSISCVVMVIRFYPNATIWRTEMLVFISMFLTGSRYVLVEEQQP